MGTKRPSCTLFDSFLNINTPDRKLQPGGRHSMDPSPRPAMTAQSERESNRKEELRRDREQEKMRDKSRYKDTDPRERHYERDRGPSSRPWEAEREWRGKRQEDDRRNGRLLSNVEREFEREMERGMKKGDTFPRMRRRSGERDESREHRRQRDRPSRMETDGREREREQVWLRERGRESDNVRRRAKEDGRNYEKSRQRYQESNAALRDNRRDFEMGGKRTRTPSPRSQRQREIHPDRKERERTHRRGGGTRSEGDDYEREMRRDRARDNRERDELTYQHSRSEGDSKSRDLQGRREADRARRGEEREPYGDGRGWSSDKKEKERRRVNEPRKERQRQEREADRRWNDTTLKEAAPRAPPRAQSSGEWSSDMDNDTRRTPGRDNYEGEGASERDDRKSAQRAKREQRRSEKEMAATEQRRMWLEPQRSYNSKESSVEDDLDRERKEEEEKEGEAQRGHVESWRHEHRRGKDREEVNVDQGEQVQGESEKRENEWKIGGSWRRDAEDNSEESDRENEAGSEGGSEAGWRQDRVPSAEDGFVTVSSGGDDEDEREEFVDCQDFWEGGDASNAPSSDGWTKEDYANEEELEGREKKPKYVFCVIGQTRAKPDGMSPSQAERMDDEERDNLLSESLHHSGDDVSLQPPHDLHLTQRRSDEYLLNSNKEADRDSNKCTETPAAGYLPDQDPRMKARKVEHPYAEIGPMKRDSRTEKLLMEWRERNKQMAERDRHSPLPSNPYADVYSQVTFEQILPALEGINIEAMSPEEKEAIRIRMSGAWSMSEEPKRHSQAPHLKWAKSVVREILGHSGEDVIDDPSSGVQGLTQPEESQVDEVTQETAEMHFDSSHSEQEPEDEEPEVEGLRGTGQGRRHMHADQLSAMHADTSAYTHSDTLLDTERKEDHNPETDKDTEPDIHSEEVVIDVKMTEETDDEVKKAETDKEASRQKEVEMYLCVSNTLYKPSSCPILNYESQPDLLIPSTEGPDDEEEAEGEEKQDEGSECSLESESDGDSADGAEPTARTLGGGTLTSTCSFRDLGPQARLRRRGIRKTTERRNEELVEVEEEVEEEEGVARDRRTRIFTTTDDGDDRCKSWGEVELRNVLDTIGRRRRNSKFFNAAQLYQQYSEAAQNFEILSQSRSSDVISVSEDSSASPAPSPPLARRPLPLPPVPHPHSLAHTGSITSVRSLPLPEQPKNEGRPSSPRLSISLTQSSTLWRELPGVRNSSELEDLTEDERRLQEVRFEVVTSEASYCRSLDIVVEHFVKSKQLGALLTTQDRNWLFSRLADVRAISHSFLSKLEERLESDIMHFTVCDIIARQCQRFRLVYVPYLTNQSYQDTTYQRLMNENQGFKRIVEKLERSPVCQRLPLRSFLVLPFQRITRIKLLVQNIVKRTTPGTADAMQAIKALKLLEKLIQESNDSISQMKSIESLVALSSKVDFECRTLPLVSQSRRLVREGPVTELMDFSLKDTERNIYMHLFNDYLLLSQQKESGRYTVIDHAPVAELRAENCRVKLHSLQKNLFRLHMSHKSLLLRTDTQSDKLRWISALSRPHAEIDFSSAQDFPQMQCIRAFVAQQPDEMSLEKADIILVHQQSSDHWVEGTRLSDRHRGWVQELHLELISNSRVQQRNLSDALKLTTATAAV
ncbi:trichohyalin isoform X1 [Dunckerocampus dactyliophorus]|uniref:trichohyalin isoform X1 n=1 Tax=Dunckerocampus dactyliophorus TaxID=161453 RepID=UPI0024072F08|nr:trichohyalin isoform X1 [Dunckerocampus dactyliophorus]XP_054637953.1 trichohyalin isoform X1 [Dunckerocampus dactyliophorus]